MTVVRLNRAGTTIAATALLVGALLVTGCGGDDSGAAAVATDASQAPSLNESQGAEGEITVCANDSGADHQYTIDKFNQAFEDQGLEAELLKLPASADEQRDQIIQRFEAESSECDVISADTVFMAEFAAQGWLLDMTDYVTDREDEFIDATLDVAVIDDRFLGVPYDSDAAFIYYRKDQVPSAPDTWQELYEAAAEQNGIVYQGAPYEGLTVDYLEIALAAGGQVLSEDGSESVIDSPENLAALELMVEGVESGTAVSGVTTYMEEEARRAFEGDKATFMRNWPYAYALGQESRIAGKYDVEPLPAFDGAGTAGILGGKNYVISSFSENPEAAMLYVDFATTAELNAERAVKYARVPVFAEVYDDPEVKKALPFAPELLQAVEQATARPITPVYPQVTRAIYENVNAALSGRLSPEEALQQADAEINEALETF